MGTLYDRLDIRPDDDAGAVKEAFRKAVKFSHPDLNADDPDAPARFMEIVRANAILSDPELRAVYDRMLEFERRQHQLASGTYKIVPDAIVVVVLAVVMAGAYTLYTNLPEVSVYLPGIFTAKVKAAANSAREPADTETVRPSPPAQARIVDTPRNDVASTAAPALNSVAATERNAVAANDAAREPDAAAVPPTSPGDADTASGPPKAANAAVPALGAVATTEKDAVAAASPTPGADNAVAKPSQPIDANTAGGPRDQHEGIQAPALAAAAPAADAGVAAKDVAVAPSTVATPAADQAIETTPANGPPPSPPVKDAQFYRQQGIASYRNGDLPAAIADFDLAIRLDPNLEDAYIDRGIVLYRLHLRDRAFADVAQAMRLEHSHRSEPPLPRSPH
jgi:tetratricopeptide (TPR) repeat protein